MKYVLILMMCFAMQAMGSSMNCNKYLADGTQYCELKYRDGSGYLITQRIRFACMFGGQQDNCML